MDSALHIAPRDRRLLGAWLLLALTALGLSTICAVLLVAARAPLPGGFVASGELFGRALVLHVGLATVVWFLACAAAFWALAAQRAHGIWQWAAFGAAATGLGAMVLALFAAGATPVLANYIPVLDHPLFLAGLVLFAAGILAHGACCARGALGGLARAGAWRSGALLSLVAALFAFGALLASAVQVGLPASADGYEALAWGPGHVLQFVHVLLLMSAWTVLAEPVLGQDAAPRRFLRALFALAALPLLAVPVIYLLHPVASPEFRHAFTLLMAWGCWPAAAVLGTLLAARVLRARAAARAPALLLSILLFLIGCALGAMIRNDSTMVPAHYHGTVGAVTLAYMALGYRFLAQFGFVLPNSRAVRWQPLVYGSGLAVLALALAWSGWLGVPRKTLHVDVLIQYPAYVAAMGLAGLGGALAVAGAAMFVLNMTRALFASSARSTANRLSLRPFLTRSVGRRDVRLPALGLTVCLTLVIGVLIQVWPNDVNAIAERAAAPVHGFEQATHVRSADVHRSFNAAVEHLAARRYQAASAELQHLLSLAPRMPEAHVNMGFAMIGLEQYALARDYFGAAIDLRTTQMNAYYGLGIALEAVGDLPGALGAMRTYLHRSPSDDPFARKAGAAVWEWEEKLSQSRMAPQTAAVAIPEIEKSTHRYPIPEKRFD